MAVQLIPESAVCLLMVSLLFLSFPRDSSRTPARSQSSPPHHLISLTPTETIPTCSHTAESPDPAGVWVQCPSRDTFKWREQLCCRGCEDLVCEKSIHPLHDMKENEVGVTWGGSDLRER